MQIQIITTKEELQATIDDAVQKALSGIKVIPSENQQNNQDEFVRGISGLANLLKCSKPTAQKLKSSGKIPFYQEGRTLLFVQDEVLKAMRGITRKIA